jgi:chromosomal replication initiation ATPase DnaA
MKIQPYSVGDHSIAAIIEAAGGVFQATSEEILSRCKERELSMARFLAYLLVREARPYWSYPRIAKAFERKHHSTVMHGLKRGMSLLSDDPAFRHAYITAKTRLHDSTQS